jgi:hypothetical protein
MSPEVSAALIYSAAMIGGSLGLLLAVIIAPWVAKVFIR